MARVKIAVPSDTSAPSLVRAVLAPFASAAGLDADDTGRLYTVVECLVAFALEHAYPGDDLGEIEVTLEAGEDSIHVAVHDWGVPLTSSGGSFGPLPEPLMACAADARDVQLVNLGADGKRLTADVHVHAAPAAGLSHVHMDAVPRRAHAAGDVDAIEVRPATPEDAEAISQLLYENYHLSYVHGDFYRPRYLMAQLAAGEMFSTIASHEGRIIGHHALMPVGGASSAETGAAVVHSSYRGLGIFGRMFDHTLDAARKRGLESVFGDAVTIHPFSQRAELSHGYRETALQLAMVPAQTTMRGLGGDDPRRRTATLRSYRPFDDRPREGALPTTYDGLLRDVYANVGLPVASRTRPAQMQGDAVATAVDGPRALGFVRVCRWDSEGRTSLTKAVRHVLARHVDIVYADVDLVGVHAVDEAVAELNELGFFAAGLVLHGPDGHDHFRLQRLASDDVELAQIVCVSPFAEALRERVLTDKARVDG